MVNDFNKVPGSVTVAIALADYANQLSGGYLKMWKAVSIIDVLDCAPQIRQDQQRFNLYLQSCLSMEGFGLTAIDYIQTWLTAHYNSKA